MVTEDRIISSSIGQIEPFQIEIMNGINTQQLEKYFIANNIVTNKKKLAVFLKLVGPKTYSLISCLISPEKPGTKFYRT